MDATSDISTSSSRPSHSISEYTLLEFLGEGATAQVYLAEHEASGARVAIKVIDKLLIQRAQLESKVRQEMVLHSELQHPHVLRVESVFEDARNYYMTLEYCARRSLSAVVKTLPGRKLDEQLVKRLFRQVVAGVVYLHASGVIHRDLKLANLLLTGTGNVKISDFGLAARLGDGHVTMCGTPNFIAPEVLTAEDEPYDEAVDVWSLGCILYCLLFGKPPFEGRKVSETLENVANAGQNPLKFPEGFSSSASDLIKRLLTTDPRSRPSAQQILLHPWLREPHQKKAPSSNRRRKSLPNTPQPVPTHPRAASRSPERLRERRRAAVNRSMKEEAILLSSSSSSVPVVVKPRRRTLEGTRVKSEQHGHFEARSSSMGFSQHQAMQSALVNSSSSSSSSPDDASMDFPDDYSDLSELSLSSTFCARSEQKEGNEETEKRHQDDEKPVFNVSSRSADPVVSVIMHFEMEDVSCFGISQNHERSSSQDKIQLQWSCKESAEVGISPTFELKVSNGWEACYDPASGILVVTTAEGDPLRYEIPGVSGARTSSSSSCASSQMQRAHLSPLVRFCQCLALRAMQLRQIILRGHRIKLPFIHYDTLPKSLLASFQHRSSLPRSLHQAAPLTNQVSVGQGIAPDGSTRVREEVEVTGVGRGYIDPTGDLRVVFLDGSQLALAASGLQLRFRPSWAPADNAKEDVFELLTTSSMSSFLPSIVKTKLESIPEFIRRLKAAN